ncbi:hypothetical protein FGO68_gene15977 [Halteria grandinella]|uniref:Uncharacterized protein n=1 Tax=Halteria grandinella TaxID=5974 RepID=A0A8J8SWZ0_HALGN|nr:hypothetical protein FGO68_gene15977 [Halteria grandinella]
MTNGNILYIICVLQSPGTFSAFLMLHRQDVIKCFVNSKLPLATAQIIGCHFSVDSMSTNCSKGSSANHLVQSGDCYGAMFYFMRSYSADGVLVSKPFTYQIQSWMRQLKVFNCSTNSWKSSLLAF